MKHSGKWKNFDGAWMIVTGKEIGLNDIVKTVRNDGMIQYVQVVDLLFSDSSHKYWRPGRQYGEITKKQREILKNLAAEYPEYADNIYHNLNGDMSSLDASNLISYVVDNYHK